MANRDRSGRVDPLVQGGSNSNLFDLDAKVYGEIHAADGSMQVVESIRLDDISPDPGQPRRIIPAGVRAVASGRNIPFLFDTWATMAFKEMSAVDATPMQTHELYRAMIEGRLEEDGRQLPEKPGHVEASILKVAELAANIRQVGLTYPITVAPAPEGLVDTEYVIETGERRYWAYRLLNFYYGEQWLRIPAKIQPKVDIWKQASENNQRDDLNAIQKARQLAILLMDLLQKEEYEKAKAGDRAAVKLFAPIAGFAREQEYYAQVADAAKWRVPYGKMEMLLPAMGLKNRVNLSQYRTMLKLPPEIWVEADDKNYSRDSLLQIVTVGNNLDPERPDFSKKPSPPAPLPQGDTERAPGAGGSKVSGGNISQVPPTPPSKPTPPTAPAAPPQAGQGSNIPKSVSHTDEKRVGASADPFRVGAWVKTQNGRIGIITKVMGETVEVEIDGRFGPYPKRTLSPAPMAEGMAVKTRTRHIGWIVGGVGTNAVQVRSNGAVTEHHPETLKPVNRAPVDTTAAGTTPAKSVPGQVRQINLDHYPNAMGLSWGDRYKHLEKVIVGLVFVQTSYGHMALRESAKAADAAMGSAMPTATVYGNTEYGMAFFAKEYRVVEEIVKSGSDVFIYKESKDMPGVNTFWVKHVMGQKPTSVNTTPAKTEDSGGMVRQAHQQPDAGQPDPQIDDSEPVPDVTPNQAMDAFVDLIGGVFTEDRLELVRLFWIQKCHESGIMTPWDSDTAITGWLAQNLVENSDEIIEGLTLERVEAAQHVLAQARRWLEKRSAT